MAQIPKNCALWLLGCYAAAMLPACSCCSRCCIRAAVLLVCATIATASLSICNAVNTQLLCCSLLSQMRHLLGCYDWLTIAMALLLRLCGYAYTQSMLSGAAAMTRQQIMLPHEQQDPVDGCVPPALAVQQIFHDESAAKLTGFVDVQLTISRRLSDKTHCSLATAQQSTSAAAECLLNKKGMKNECSWW